MQNKSELADHLRTTPKRRRGWFYDEEKIARQAQEKRERDEVWERQEVSAMDAIPAHFGLCYFIGNVGEGIVKIGYSRDVNRRRSQLAGQSPFRLRILATAHGADEREGYYHSKFKEYALGGEWFTLSPDILAEIARLNGGAHV